MFLGIVKLVKKNALKQADVLVKQKLEVINNQLIKSVKTTNDKTLEQVLQQGGTAAGSAINVKGKKMGGKTGTSQVRSISKKERESGVLTNEQLKWNMRNHGLFVGYAPLDNPKYAVCVVTEHSGSSGPAAKTASAIIKELLIRDAK